MQLKSYNTLLNHLCLIYSRSKLLSEALWVYMGLINDNLFLYTLFYLFGASTFNCHVLEREVNYYHMLNNKLHKLQLWACR